MDAVQKNVPGMLELIFIYLFRSGFKIVEQSGGNKKRLDPMDIHSLLTDPLQVYPLACHMDMEEAVVSYLHRLEAHSPPWAATWPQQQPRLPLGNLLTAQAALSYLQPDLVKWAVYPQASVGLDTCLPILPSATF